MTQDFVKYPRTAHLEGSCLQRGDEADRTPLKDLVDGEFFWEEKIDGANCAVSFDSSGKMVLQSRGHVLSGGPREKQFDLFKAWARNYEWTFKELLGARYIVYGEWCYAKHTIFYDKLPHYFLEFDVYDKLTGKFLSTPLRHMMFEGTPIVSVPVVHQGPLTTLKELKSKVVHSLYKSENWAFVLNEYVKEQNQNFDMIQSQTDFNSLAEGLYLKQEKNDEVIGRYKWVRSDFLQTILDSDSHWHDRPILPNLLESGIDIFNEDF